MFSDPGLMRVSDRDYPNLGDFWSGKSTLEEITRREMSMDPLCTWQEIREMDEAGVIDFQSHSMYHSLIFTTPFYQGFHSSEI